MGIQIPIDKINELSPNEYFILVLIGLKDFKTLNELISTRRREYTANIIYLCEKGYVNNVEKSMHVEAEHLVITKEGFSQIDKKALRSKGATKKEVEAWIQEWRNLFPSGKSGGYPIKGSKLSCTNKMVNFIKKYGFSKETIFSATKKYLGELEDFNYIQNAPYFIEKWNVSNLAAFCEEIENGGEEEIKKDNMLNL